MADSPDREFGSGHGVHRLYVVEARTLEPSYVNGILLTPTWKRISTVESNAGVPLPRYQPPAARDLGLMEYPAAVAIAALMRAGVSEYGSYAYGVETRYYFKRPKSGWETP